MKILAEGSDFMPQEVGAKRISVPVEVARSIAEDIEIRLRLCPPYREHLSQAFARYFMRVGLSINIHIEK